MNLQQLKHDLERDESRETHPYADSVGKQTIGIGRNLTDRGLSQDEIDYLYDNDARSVIADLNNNLPWWRQLSEPRQRVLANMCFNLGILKLLGFKTTLAAMERGDYPAAAEGMRASKWAAQVGPRADRLIKMMIEG